MSKRVAFVSPFFGPLASGGAEAECRRTAIELARAGCEVDVLTTCLRDLQHGIQVNAFAEGIETDNGVTVRRFRVASATLDHFVALNARILAGETLTRDEETAFMAHHVSSEGLLRYLAEHHTRYTHVCFIPYLFGTSVLGWRICPDKAILIPCLHDEGYARMQLVREMFEGVRRVVFHVPSEAALARERIGSTLAEASVIGEGVGTDLPGEATRFREKTGIKGPFVLCAGRKSEEKNTPLLIRHFADFLAARPDDAKLVLIGPGHVPIPDGLADRVIDLGYVNVETKYDAMAAATVFCQPSVNESFSIVLMESWDHATPALVHANCAVTREHVVRANAGLYFDGAAAFTATLSRLLNDSELRSRMGEAGRDYVRANYAWPTITQRYIDEVLV